MDGTALSASIQVPTVSFIDAVDDGRDQLRLDAGGVESSRSFCRRRHRHCRVRGAQSIELRERFGTSVAPMRRFRDAGFRVDLLATRAPDPRRPHLSTTRA